MGRPRRSVPRVQAHFQVDPHVKALLQSQARDVGAPLLTYLYNVVSRAHDYSGEELKLPVTALLSQSSMDTLQELVRHIDSGQCVPSPVYGGPKVTVRLDEPLARCLQHHAHKELDGQPYTSYLRAVLYLIAGVPLAGLGDQPDLGFDVPDKKEEATPRRRAS